MFDITRRTFDTISYLLASTHYPDNRARAASRERSRDNAFKAQSNDLCVPFGDHGDQSADQDTQATEIREPAQCISHDQLTAVNVRFDLPGIHRVNTPEIRLVQSLHPVTNPR